jgi:hypothetical protein
MCAQTILHNRSHGAQTKLTIIGRVNQVIINYFQQANDSVSESNGSGSGIDQERTGNGVGVDWEQIRSETPFPGMDRTFRNGLGIHQESGNEPGVHKECWGSVKFCSFHQSRHHAPHACSENPEVQSKCHLQSTASGWVIQPGVNDALQVQQRVMCWLHQYCGLMLSFPKTVETLVAGNLQG